MTCVPPPPLYPTGHQADRGQRAEFSGGADGRGERGWWRGIADVPVEPGARPGKNGLVHRVSFVRAAKAGCLGGTHGGGERASATYGGAAQYGEAPIVAPGYIFYVLRRTWCAWRPSCSTRTFDLWACMYVQHGLRVGWDGL